MTKQIIQAVATPQPQPVEKGPTTSAPHVHFEDTPDTNGEAHQEAQPARMTLTTHAPELVVTVEARELKEEDNTNRGRVATLIGDGFFREPQTGDSAYKYWAARGFKQSSSRIYEAIGSLVKDGFLIMHPGKKYQQHPNLKVTRQGEKKVTLTIQYK